MPQAPAINPGTLLSHAQINMCPFCNPDQARVILECKYAIAIHDAFPLAEGHSLVIPRRHVRSIYDLDAAEQDATWTLVREVRAFLVREFAPDGFNIGVNDGQHAGQTIEYAHVHVVPRYKGDVPDPRGGVRNVISTRARYWER